MTMIVSANYRNRQSEFRWLVRDAKQDPSEAVAYRTVTATGVAFCPSTAFETGFGCSTVAFCKSAIGSNDPSNHDPKVQKVRLRFNGAYFVDPQGHDVSVCESLHLGADGSMHAGLEAAKKRKRERENA